MARRHPIQDTRDAVCLLAYLEGWTVEELAEIIGKSERTIHRWLKRAKETSDPPDLELWMSGFGKQCPHSKPIVRGMPVLCLDCDQTGMPNHPAFRQGEPLSTASEDQPDGPAKFRANVKQPKKRTAKL